jgi:hypothetical protein
LLNLTGNKISTQTGIGTSIAIAGVAMYSYIKAKIEEEKRVSFPQYMKRYQWKCGCTFDCCAILLYIFLNPEKERMMS